MNTLPSDTSWCSLWRTQLKTKQGCEKQHWNGSSELISQSECRTEEVRGHFRDRRNGVMPSANLSVKELTHSTRRGWGWPGPVGEGWAVGDWCTCTFLGYVEEKKIEKSMFCFLLRKKNLDFAAIRLLFFLDYRSEFLPLSPCWRGEPGKAFWLRPVFEH